jgi:hypothetical protein
VYPVPTNLEGSGDEALTVEVEQVEAKQANLHLHIRLCYILPLPGRQHLHGNNIKTCIPTKGSVLRIRIRMFLGLKDPNPLVSGADPDPSIIKQT